MNPTEVDAELEDLLVYIQITRGVDFTGYKRTSLSRRIRRRMDEVGVGTIGEYRDLLEAHVDEFGALFDTVLINVTSFFRDKAAWDYLATHVVPEILERKRPGEPIRVWSAGCASGQEAYTIAMILAEALGPGELRNAAKIYATDVDNGALAQARQGSYSLKDMADVPEALRQRYFEAVDGRFVFRNGLRRAVIFGRHDLTSDAPIGRLDLLVCRNTLMYFNADTQSRVLDRFHFALEDDSYLFLGKAEMLLSHASLFTPLSMRHRVFQKTGRSSPGDLTSGPEVLATAAQAVRSTRLRDLAMDITPLATLGVDHGGLLTMANAEARVLFGLGTSDLGQPFENLEVSYRPVELRSRLEQAYTERRPVHLRNVERVVADGDSQYFDVTVAPLIGPDDLLIGATVIFADVTATRRLREELQRSRQDLETAYEELRSTNEELETTNEELQSSNEELETTNEELQSTNEELETTNEELQSSNEELETMNEELRSTNEELEGANSELRSLAVEEGRLSQHLQSLLSSLVPAVVAVDRELLVELWNKTAEDLWGLRAEEVEGRSFATLDIGLPVGPLQPAIRACLDGRSERESVEVEGLTRTGRPAHFRALVTPVAGSLPPSGVVLVIEEDED